MDIDDAAADIARARKADDRSFTGDFMEAEYVDKNRRRFLCAVKMQRNVVKAANRMFVGDVPIAPCWLILAPATPTSASVVPSDPLRAERAHRSASPARGDEFPPHETLSPVVDRAQRDSESQLPRLSNAWLARFGVEG